MKITYEFDMPDDRNAHNLVHNASDMYNCLFNIDEILRKHRKGWVEKPDIDVLLEDIRNELYDSKFHEIE